MYNLKSQELAVVTKMTPKTFGASDALFTTDLHQKGLNPNIQKPRMYKCVETTVK